MITTLGTSSFVPTVDRNTSSHYVFWNQRGLLFDVGDGTHRQLLKANLSFTKIHYIFITHFHGDHCLGLGSLMMGLSASQLKHSVHLFYPAAGQEYLDSLLKGSVSEREVTLIQHPIEKPGKIYQDTFFTFEAEFLEHRTTCLGYRVTEPDKRKFDSKLLKEYDLEGSVIGELRKKGSATVHGKTVTVEEVSNEVPGKSIAIVLDTLPCEQAVRLARKVNLLLSESTYQTEHEDLAREYKHMTAAQAAGIAKEAGAQKLVLTHFSKRIKDMRELEKEAQAIFPNSTAANDFDQFEFS